MARHLMSRPRVFTLGAAVVVAAALAGAAAGAAAPAYAAPGRTVAVSPSSVDLKGGDSRPVTIKLTSAGLPDRATVTVTAPTGLAGDVTIASSDSTCSGSGATVTCTVDLPPDAQKSVVVTLTAKNPDSLGAGQSRTDTTGTVSVVTGMRTTSASYTVTLHGPAQAQAQPQTSTTAASTGAAGAAGGSGTAGGSGQAGATGADPGASSATADPGATGQDAAAGYGTESPATRAATDPTGVSGLLVAAGVLLVVLGGATIAVLVVRHRRARLTEAPEPEPWPDGDTSAPAVPAVLRAPNAPVDPWETHPC
jgi:hypothetical protein